jgi:hypothetical protein
LDSPAGIRGSPWITAMTPGSALAALSSIRTMRPLATGVPTIAA